MYNKEALLRLAVLVAIVLFADSVLHCNAAVATDPTTLRNDVESEVIERGQDYSIHRKISMAAGPSGSIVSQTNQFALLENCMHYHDGTQWRESEDLIEIAPQGAIAQRGPNKASFNGELNSKVVFDVLASDGKRLAGGIRGLQLTDSKSGESVTIGLVRDSVEGKLLPPNTLLWSDAFTGVKADVVVVWKHNVFSQDVILKERPTLPKGWDPANVQLEIATEFYVEKEPELRTATISSDKQSAVEDHAVIHFGSLAMVMGKAFGASDKRAIEFGGLTTDGVSVVKEWVQTPDGNHFLIESVRWQEVQDALESLPAAQQASNAKRAKRSQMLALGWPPSQQPQAAHKPIQVAALDYNPKGLLVDFTIIPDAGTPSTLAAGTYYIKTSYYNGSSVTFSPGCVIKFKNDANMILYGPISFPSSVAVSSMPVFTSRNDDSVGDIIQMVAGETDSDGNPALHTAAQSLWIYYNTYATEIRNARIFWSKVGVRRDRNSICCDSIYIHDCYFANITGAGSAGFSGATTGLTSSNLKMCHVTTPGLTMTTDCIGIENSLPGTVSWKLTTPATGGWPGGLTVPEIEGFASATSVNVGGSLDLYVDVRTGGADYTIDVYRLGWYGSIGGRKVAKTISKTNGAVRTVPTPDANGMIDCLAGASPWPVSHTLTIPTHWVSGVYLAKLHGVVSGKESYIIFVVREDARSSDLYFQSSVATFQTYNPWGGRSGYPYPAAMATHLSFNRPYAAPIQPELAYGTGAGEFFALINSASSPGWEYNALRWMEKQGYDLTYCTSIDTHRAWPAGKTVKAFISVGHDEYWSQEMRTNVESKRSAGVNLVFLGANTCYWRIHMDAGERAFTVFKNNDADLWRAPGGANNHEIGMVGVEYVFNSLDVNMTIPAGLPNSWVYDYTGIINNGVTVATSLPGLLGAEIDGEWVEDAANRVWCRPLPDPYSPSPSAIKVTQSDYIVNKPDPGCFIHFGTARSYSILQSTASTGNTFASGSNQWPWGLDDANYSTFNFPPGGLPGSRVSSVARQITHNILQKFAGKTTSPSP